jgi:two-component system OmpR family response regulator
LFGSKIVFLGVISYCATYNYTPVNIMNEPLKSQRALIIDDEIDICFLLKSILHKNNIPADYVTSLSEAKKLLQDLDPPIIFLDNHLSDGLGINYIRQLKKEHPVSKIVMITAHDNSSDREKAYREGVDFFISKPFTREIILRTLGNIEGPGH